MKRSALLTLGGLLLLPGCGDQRTLLEVDDASLAAVHGEGVPAPQVYHRMSGESLTVTWRWRDEKPWDLVSFDLDVEGRKVKGEWNIKPYTADPEGSHREFSWTGGAFPKGVPAICVSVMAKAESGKGQRTVTYHARNCETEEGPPLVGSDPPVVILRPETITTGGYHSCGLTDRGSAYCWGWNGQGQLGVGDEHRLDRHYPAPVAGGLAFAQISAGAGHTCGVTPTGAAYCWGFNASGQLGDGTTTRQLVPTPVAGGLSFTQISAASVNASSLWPGGSHTCALTSGGVVYCWGSNYYGQLGDGSQSSRLTPVAIVGDLAFRQISAGARHTCGVATSGAAYCWGNHYTGEVGDGSPPWGEFMDESAPRPLPTAVAGGLSFAQVSAGGQHTCGLTPAGKAYCWGNGLSGQLGDGILHAPATSPSAVVGDRAYSQITAGRYHSCAYTPSGEAWCWGSNADGQLGDGNYQTQSASPRMVAGGRAYTQISAGNRHTCGVTPSGEAYCWGYNYNGQVGLYPYNDWVYYVLVPAQVRAPQLVLSKISAGGAHTCALAPWGEAFCWGDNHVGQLGDGTWRWTKASARVVDVWGGLVFQEITSGDQHSCGLTGSGAAYCWGSNEFGQLGDGTTTTRGYPASVPGGLTFSFIGAGVRHTCALTAAGQAYCWGDYGAAVHPSPQPVGLLEFTQLTAGDRFTCALRAETAYCWGRDNYGQLGDASNLDRAYPAPVYGGHVLSEVAAGARHACAVTGAGAAYCWGLNNHGQLGDGSTTEQHLPTPVTGAPVFTRITGGDDHTCALTGAGEAHCWGRNDSGQLGDGTTIGRLGPAAVTGWLYHVRISAGGGHTCSLTPEGAAYCWGKNAVGQLGDGTTTSSGVPRASAELFFNP
jgi:alpha-tubulin suppressor-like RCC1 family protein